MASAISTPVKPVAAMRSKGGGASPNLTLFSPVQALGRVSGVL